MTLDRTTRHTRHTHHRGIGNGDMVTPKKGLKVAENLSKLDIAKEKNLSKPYKTCGCGQENLKKPEIAAKKTLENRRFRPKKPSKT